MKTVSMKSINMVRVMNAKTDEDDDDDDDRKNIFF